MIEQLISLIQPNPLDRPDVRESLNIIYFRLFDAPRFKHGGYGEHYDNLEQFDAWIWRLFTQLSDSCTDTKSELIRLFLRNVEFDDVRDILLPR